MPVRDEYQAATRNRATSLVSKLKIANIDATIITSKGGIATVITKYTTIYVLLDYYELWVNREWTNIHNEEILTTILKGIHYSNEECTISNSYREPKNPKETHHT